MIQIDYHGRFVRAVIEQQGWTYQLWAKNSEDLFPIHSGSEVYTTPDQALTAGMYDVDTQLVRLALIRPLCALHRTNQLASEEVSQLLTSIAVPSRRPHGFTKQVVEW